MARARGEIEVNSMQNSTEQSVFFHHFASGEEKKTWKEILRQKDAVYTRLWINAATNALQFTLSRLKISYITSCKSYCVVVVVVVVSRFLSAFCIHFVEYV